MSMIIHLLWSRIQLGAVCSFSQCAQTTNMNCYELYEFVCGLFFGQLKRDVNYTASQKKLETWCP